MADPSSLPPLPCRLLVAPEVLAAAQGDGEGTGVSALKTRLEKGSTREKERALDALIAMLALEGDARTRQDLCAQMLVPVLRFVMPVRSAGVKGRVLLFLEQLDGRIGTRLHSEGTPLLLVNALLKELQGPNEYVRAAALRFMPVLGAVVGTELLAPLIEGVKASFTHDHPLVRRHAALGLARLHALLPTLLPDASELLEGLLEGEKEPAVRRACWVSLLAVDEPRALERLAMLEPTEVLPSPSPPPAPLKLPQVLGLGDLLQGALLRLLRTHAHAPSLRGRALRVVHAILAANVPAHVHWEVRTLHLPHPPHSARLPKPSSPSVVPQLLFVSPLRHWSSSSSRPQLCPSSSWPWRVFGSSTAARVRWWPASFLSSFLPSSMPVTRLFGTVSSPCCSTWPRLRRPPSSSLLSGRS